MLVFENYSAYIALLQSAPAELLSKMLHVLAALACLLIGGMWLPSFLLLPRGRKSTVTPAQTDETQTHQSAQWLALCMLGGVISCVTFWTLSLFLFQRTGPGTVGVSIVALYGLTLTPRLVGVGWWRQRGWLLLAVTCAALGMGFWQFAATELHVGERVAFSDRHLDLSFHVHAASVITASGLPRIELNGLAEEPFSVLVHTGYGVLMGGFSRMTGMSLYQSAASLWIVAYLVIGWSSLTLVGRWGLSQWASFIAAIAGLIWAQAVPPPAAVLFDPTAASIHLEKTPVSALLYHNFPQAWSIAVMAGGLVCLDLSAHLSHRRRLALGLATWAMVVSGWIKPALIILFGPALILLLIVNRRQLLDFIIVLTVFAVGVIVYFLPAFLHDLPSHPTWILAPSRDKFWEGSRFFALGLGAGLPFAVGRLRGVRKEGLRSAELRWEDVAFVAAAGGYLFLMLFVEERFGELQPNLWWGISGCLVLFAPAVVAWCANAGELVNRAPMPTWIRRFACCVVAIQLLNGAAFAAVYPLISLRSHALERIRALQQAGAATLPGTKFCVDPGMIDVLPRPANVDPGLEHPDLFGYLGRPVLFLTVMSNDPVRREMSAWWSFIRTGDTRLIPFVNSRDAIILHSSRTRARATLLDNGWKVTHDLPGDFQLIENSLHQEARVQSFESSR